MSDSQAADLLPTTAGWTERPDELKRHTNKNNRGLWGRTKGLCTPGVPPILPLGSPTPFSRRPRSLPGWNAAPSSRGTRTPRGRDRGLAPPPEGISALSAPAPPLPRPAPHKGPLSCRVPGLWFLKSSRRKTEGTGKKKASAAEWAGSVGQGQGGAAAGGVPSKTSTPRGASGARREITRALDCFGVGEVDFPKVEA